MITPAQSRGARGFLDWTQGRLASEAGVSLSTVKDFEAGRRTPIGNNLAAMQRVFEAAGAEFLDDGKPGVRLVRVLTAEPAGAPKRARRTKTAAREKTHQRARYTSLQRPL